MKYFSQVWVVAFIFCMLSSIGYADETIISRFAVCTSTDCPNLPSLATNSLSEDEVIIFETSPAAFMARYSMSFSEKDNGGWHKIFIDEQTFLENLPVVGFGGSFTDSAAILYKNLPPDLKEKIIKLYYSPEGIHYSLGRVPMASSDFSCRVAVNGKGMPGLGPCSRDFSPYTYLDQKDPAAQSFALQSEDLLYKIPMIKDALAEVAKHHTDLKLFASPWSAPAWMKTNGKIVHGSLLPEYQKTWTTYILNFLKSYKNYQIKFWGITVQNEPEERSDLGERFQTWQTMYYTPEQEASFVKNFLGPAIRGYEKQYGSPINIIVHDDQVTSIETKANIMNDPQAKQYIAGLGLHWYTNTDFFYPKIDNAFRTLNPVTEAPSRFILGTEACEGYLPWAKGPSLGNWSRGEAYAHDIISDLNHHVSGWTDWNLLLNKQGGPNWADNHVDAPILVDTNSHELYLQPMYYYLGHFSRFIRPGSKMLGSFSQGPFPLEVVSFKVPAQYASPENIVIVVLNRDRFSRTYYVQDITKKTKSYINVTIPGHAIQTIIFKARPIQKA